jgi:hypothetical protein
VCGGAEGTVTLRAIEDLQTLRQLNPATLSPIACLQLAPKDLYMVVGQANGAVSVCLDVRKRLNMICAGLENLMSGM